MIVDTSAILAILRGEEPSDDLIRVILGERTAMSAAAYVDLMTRAGRSDEAASRIDNLLHLLAIEVVPVTVEQARLAAQAHRTYGRTPGHRSGLDYADTFAYALAIARAEPLLFVGDAFVTTDVRMAVRPG